MSTNYIDQITDTAGTTQDISESDSTRIFRATCSTSASTTAKVATLQTSNKNFSLAAGVRVAVTFTYGNTATTPTLRVDGSATGTAKTIAIASSATAKTTGNGTTYNTWGPYETVLFTYDGTYWVNGGSSRSIYNAYMQASSAGTGTVTSVGITNGGGLSISGSPITTSGSITVGHSNSVTAQTTQAVYPVKIDAQGHISAYGSAVTIPTVPTNVSAFTNDAGYITSYTDTKVTQTEIDTNSRPNDSLRLLFSNSGISGTVTSGVSYINWLYYNPSENELTLSGSGTISATNLYGTELGGDTLHLSSGSPSWYDNTLTATGTTANRSYNLPNKSGTVALTSDIPSSYAASSSAGGSATYAATTADTTNALYPVGVTSAATTTLKRDTSITFTGGAISCSGLTVASVSHTITSSEYTTIANALDALV